MTDGARCGAGLSFMTHLFVAHSNITLLFAQAIAASLPAAERKVIWLKLAEGDARARAAYELHLLPQLWQNARFATLLGPKFLPAGKALMRRPVGAVRQLKRNLRALDALLEDEEKQANGELQLWVAHPRLPDVLHAAQWCRARDYPVHFYEEGISIYLDEKSNARAGAPGAGRLSKANVLRRALLRAGGLSHLSRPLEPLLRDMTINYPQISTLFAEPLPTHDLSAHFNADYIARLLQKPELSQRIEEAAAPYPRAPYALFVSSVEVEDNFVDADDYFAAVAACRDLKESAGLPFLIKPHPRNRPDVLARLQRELGAQLVEEKVPVSLEILAARLNCSLVLGVCSSPLIYLPLLHGTKTASIAPRLTRARLGSNGARIRRFAQQFAAITATV